jgi:hypothetical protein
MLSVFCQAVLLLSMSNNTVIDYVKNLPETNLQILLQPDFFEPMLSALGLNKNEITPGDLPQEIDKLNITDEVFINNLLSNENFNVDLIDIDFLAEIIRSPRLANIVENEDVKKKIFKKYAEVLRSLKDGDAEPVVINMQPFSLLIQSCKDEVQKQYLNNILDDKINEIKDSAVNVKNKNDLLNFVAEKLVPDNPDETVKNVCKNLFTIYGEENGQNFQMIYKDMYATSQDRTEQQTNAYGITLAFETKIYALRKAYGIKDDEAELNSMLGGA